MEFKISTLATRELQIPNVSLHCLSLNLISLSLFFDLVVSHLFSPFTPFSPTLMLLLSSCIFCIVNSSQKHDKVSANVPPASLFFVFPAICYCLPASRARTSVPACVSITCSLFCFSSASEKQKLIKYGTRWSSISLNHHVIKMASLGDQLKRKLKNNVSSVRYLWAWLCKHAPFIRYVYFM